SSNVPSPLSARHGRGGHSSRPAPRGGDAGARALRRGLPLRGVAERAGGPDLKPVGVAPAQERVDEPLDAMTPKDGAQTALQVPDPRNAVSRGGHDLAAVR